MAILVYVDNSGGQVPKSGLETLYYANLIAKDQGTETVALVAGEISKDVLESLGNYGASKVLHASDTRLNNFDSVAYSKTVAQAVSKVDPDIIVFCHNFTSKLIAPRLSAQLNAGMVVGAVDVPKTDGGTFTVKRSVYAGKAFAYFTISTDKKIIALQSNSFSPERGSSSAVVEDFAVELADDDFRVTVKEINKATDKIPLSEASIIVSGGRGMKGPENWNLLEEMAALLPQSALACSKPVADMDWRPHAEHVGQTGLTVRPNLYFAIGISGAIQHLAGVNGSKVIVAINKDPEAPIFGSANYGIVGDAFVVLPKLIEALKKHQG